MATLDDNRQLRVSSFGISVRCGDSLQLLRCSGIRYTKRKHRMATEFLDGEILICRSAINRVITASRPPVSGHLDRRTVTRYIGECCRPRQLGIAFHAKKFQSWLRIFPQVARMRYGLRCIEGTHDDLAKIGWGGGVRLEH